MGIEPADQSIGLNDASFEPEDHSFDPNDASFKSEDASFDSNDASSGGKNADRGRKTGICVSDHAGGSRNCAGAKVAGFILR
jgi:hypothetical protein